MAEHMWDMRGGNKVKVASGSLAGQHGGGNFSNQVRVGTVLRLGFREGREHEL